MTRIAIPHSVHQKALNAADDSKRLSVALNGSATFESLCLAEAARNRAMDNLRALGPHIRAAKQAVRAEERRVAIDRKIIERDRASVEALA